MGKAKKFEEGNSWTAQLSPLELHSHSHSHSHFDSPSPSITST